MTIGSAPILSLAAAIGGAGVAYWGPIAERYGLDVTVVNDAVDPCRDLGERNVQAEHRHRARDAIQESQHVRRIDVENCISRMIFKFNIGADVWIQDPASPLPSHPKWL